MSKHRANRSLGLSVLVFGLAVTVTSVLFINFCDWVYQCGCRAWWAGAADQCNIHASSPPHCPWCMGAVAGYSSFGLVVSAQALTAFVTPGRRVGYRLLLALAAFPVVGGMAALFWGLYTGYWAG